MKTVQMWTKEEFLTLSYHSLCNLSRLTGYAYPHLALPIRIVEGEYKGLVTMDEYGNVVAFS